MTESLKLQLEEADASDMHELSEMLISGGGLLAILAIARLLL